MNVDSKQIGTIELTTNKSTKKQDYISPQIIEFMAPEFIQGGGPDTYESTNGTGMFS